MEWKKSRWGSSILGTRQGPAPAKQPKGTSRKTFVFVWSIVAVGIVILAFMFLSSALRGKPPADQDQTPTTKGVTTRKPIRGNASMPMAESSAPKAPPKSVPRKEKKIEYAKRPGQLQLPNGKILTFPPPKEGETRKVYAYGHTYECDHLGNFRDISKRQLFKTAFEANFLALANENKPFIPAFLMGLNQEDVARMLAKNYEPVGDETEEELAQIKAYDEMRAAALEYMGEGGKFDDFVDSIATFVKKERQVRAICLREVMTLYKQGKIAEAKEMSTAANVMTEQNGYKAIRLPPHVQVEFDKLP